MHMRSLWFAFLVVAVIAAGGLRGVNAQDGSLADSGLPEITATLTDEGVEGVPAETEAGWHLVTFTNDVSDSGDPFQDSWSLEFFQLSAGMTIDDLAALFAGPPPDASPEATDAAEMASPEAEGEDPFAFLYESYAAGGPGALRGETSQGVVYLQPGDYAVTTFGVGAPVAMTVTGDADAAPAAPAGVTSTATITETGTSGSFEFEVADLAAGPGILEIVNNSDQPHFVFGIHSEVAVTEDEIMALLMEVEDGGTPEAGSLEAQLLPGFITGTQSVDTTQYLAVDLQPGYYILLCFVGDPEQGGAPHSFTGMIEIVEVAV